MKKFLLIILSACLCLTFANASGEAAVMREGICGNCPWVQTDDGLLTIGDAEADEKLVLPDYSTAYGWLLGASYASQITEVRIEGEVWATGCRNMFSDLDGLIKADLTGLRTDNVTDMSRMFYDCDKLQTVVWDPDMGNVTTINSMFYSCADLKDLDSAHIGDWDTKNITDMKLAFFLCKSLTSLDLSGWDTGKAADISEMFYHCEGLTSLDVSTWNTGSVTDMSFTFSRLRSLESLDLSGWNTENTADMNNMFRYCDKLKALDLSHWDTSNVEYMHYMFQYCPSLERLDVSSWNTEKVKRMDAMFNQCGSLELLDLRSFSTKGLTSADIAVNTFRSCGASVILFTPELWDHPDNPYSSKLHENAAQYGGYTLYDEGEYRLYPLRVTFVGPEQVTVSGGTLRTPGTTAQLICASYDLNGRMLDAEFRSLPLDGAMHEFSFGWDTSEVASVRVFLADDELYPMTPIGQWYK